MSPKKFTSKQFYDIAGENEFFFLHFALKKESYALAVFSYFEEPKLGQHPLKEIVDTLKIPYYETYIEDEYDFVINLHDGFSKHVWKPKTGFNTLFAGFNRGRLITSNWHGHCMCTEGLIEIIAETNPKFLLNAD